MIEAKSKLFFIVNNSPIQIFEAFQILVFRFCVFHLGVSLMLFLLFKALYQPL
jgi:hypothetical protein